MAHDEKVDPDRPHAPAPSDRDGEFTGQEYRADDERALGRELPAGAVLPPGTTSPLPPTDTRAHPDLPSDNGRRAAVDAATGEVRGSGVGAGGEQPGEDLDNDSTSGDGTLTPHRSA